MKLVIWPLLSLLLLLPACQTQAETPPPPPIPEGVTPAPTPTPTPDIVATLAVAGDAMSHMPQTTDAYDKASDAYDYRPMIRCAKPHVEAADYAVVNLETTLGAPPYSGYPAFHTPPALAEGLKDAGFDLVSTANNHSLDKRFQGVCDTLDALDEIGLAHVGTARTQEERDEHNGVYLADVGGIQVAFLSYTYGTNGIPVAEGKGFSLNRFNLDYTTSMSTPDYTLMENDLAAAKAMDPDLIAVMIHWGIEYKTKQNAYQEQVNGWLRENGVDLVLGGHPHVLEPYVLEDGDFTCYSMGNFISGQKYQYTDTTVVYQLELTKDGVTGETTVSGVTYVPFLMLNRGEGADERFLLLDCYGALEDYENGNPEKLSENTVQRLRAAIEDCHTILGPEGDFKNS